MKALTLKSLVFSVLAGVAIGSLAGPAMAQGVHTPKVDAHQRALQVRIDRGISSGLITRVEARRLQDREAQIQRMEYRFRSDGVVSRSERAELRRAVASLDRDVDRLLSNGRRQDNRGHGYRS